MTSINPHEKSDKTNEFILQHTAGQNLIYESVVKLNLKEIKKNNSSVNGKGFI